MIYDERHEAGDAGPLDRGRKLALVPSAHATTAARHYFTIGGNKPAQSASLFVINRILVIGAEWTDVVFWFAGWHNLKRNVFYLYFVVWGISLRNRWLLVNGRGGWRR